MPSTKKFRFTDKNGNTIEVDIGAEGENVTIDGQKLTDLLNEMIEKQTTFTVDTFTSNSGSNYVATVDGLTEYKGGMLLIFSPNVTSTTKQPYLNINGLGNKRIVRRFTASMSSYSEQYINDNFYVGFSYLLQYDGNSFIDVTRPQTAWQDLAGKPTSFTPSSHASSSTTYGVGTSSNYGHVKLSDSTSSTSGVSGGTAATPSAVKAAYDKAVSIEDYAQHTSTVFVAAANARAESKSGADYVCTGTNDEETIQAAINSIVSTGGVIQLSEGTFYFSNNRTSGAVSGIALDSGIALKGAGSSTVINTYNTSGFSDNPAIGVTGSDNVTISDMLIMSGDYKFSYSIDINGSSNVEVNNIIFTLQGSDSGIFRIYNSSDVNVINSRFEVTESQTSISVTNNSKNILIKNNVFNVYDWEAIYVYGGASNVIIDGNFFKETYSNTGNSAISVNNALSNIMITNNIIDFPLAPVKVNSAASGKVFVYNNMVKTPPTASAVVQINMDGSSNNWNQTF